ncbi:tRNA glutamyl-Q synthetase [Erythrobacter sp. QSSC1-22B]|uniref:tRNA glutamyl-Q(34) synthetase GluQRS n=1 Tax=Erythrobacter sp. QSSC1-22B TaxID=1860125 RepID=UPI000805AF6C|nr:tRNA glutamyl-Q(34) synthetase GluQRS [Erythrobacter sp. QSSC1-22B]OBX19823.1 tRNA glutamyl-Q synthetase [Erythrobacter sp. QSSC1-22B]
MPITRFAPSPNGPLHLGHAYSALVAHDLAHDLARDAGGRFLLRIEDIDGARSRAGLADMFRRDLAWLGLEWDEVPAQSTRLAEYARAADWLRDEGLLYRCSCTRAEIAEDAASIGSASTAPEGPVYGGRCRRDGPVAGRAVAWRLDTARAIARTGPLTWTDALAGEQPARPELLGDVVLVRKDEPASYHLAATLDDAADGVTLVTRGQDLFTASHVHRLLQALLGLPEPRWHHHPLLLDAAGKKLAKRRNSPSLEDRRAGGEDGLLLAAQLRLQRFPDGISLGTP